MTTVTRSSERSGSFGTAEYAAKTNPVRSMISDRTDTAFQNVADLTQ